MITDEQAFWLKRVTSDLCENKLKRSAGPTFSASGGGDYVDDKNLNCQSRITLKKTPVSGEEKVKFVETKTNRTHRLLRDGMMGYSDIFRY